jgi:hypothetical protein
VVARSHEPAGGGQPAGIGQSEEELANTWAQEECTKEKASRWTPRIGCPQVRAGSAVYMRTFSLNRGCHGGLLVMSQLDGELAP